MKRILIFALVFSLMLAVLGGCKKTSGKQDGETTVTSSVTDEVGENRYDSNGYLIKEVYGTADGGDYQINKWIYNENGKLLKSWSWGTYEEYSYDTNGNKIKKEERRNGEINLIEEWVYDENDRIIKESIQQSFEKSFYKSITIRW
jgi:hypothetical protein